MHRNLSFLLFALLLVAPVAAYAQDRGEIRLAVLAPAPGSSEAGTVARGSADGNLQDPTEGDESGGQARPEKDVARGVRSLTILVVVIGFLAWSRGRRRRRMREAVRTVFGG